VVEAGHHLLGTVRGWNEETRAFATRWPEEELERTEFVVSRSHGNAAYARGPVGSLLGQRKVRIAVVSDARRRVEEPQSRDLLVQELGGPLPRGRLGEIRRELGSVVVPSVGRRGFRVGPPRRSSGNGSSTGGSCCSPPNPGRRPRRCSERTSKRMPSRRCSGRRRVRCRWGPCATGGRTGSRRMRRWCRCTCLATSRIRALS
jgi:hypothetical protein